MHSTLTKPLIEALGPQMVSAQTLSDEDFLALFELKKAMGWQPHLCVSMC